MNKSTFHRLLLELLDAINFQADLHLARATARAANTLPDTFCSPSPAVDAHALLATVRLSHYHRNSVRRYRKEPKPMYEVDPVLLAKLRRAQAAAVAEMDQEHPRTRPTP